MTPWNGVDPDNDPQLRLAALEAEISRLQAALAAAGLQVNDAQAATVVAEDATAQAVTDAAAASASQARDMEAGRANLADADALNARLLNLNAELRASEERLDAVVESATDSAIIEMDFDGRITGWSPGAERVLGWTAAEAIGRDGAIIWTPEDRAANQPARERSIAEETGSAADDRWHLRRDGTRLWGSGHLTPLRNGRPRGYLKVLRDRTAERRAEEATRASEARFRALATAGSSMLYRMSADWQLMYQLDGRDILADTPEPIEDWADRYILPEDRAAVWAAVEDAIRTRSLFALEHRVRLANGSVGWVFSRAVPILGLDGEVVEWFGAGTDVTARREAEQRQAFLLHLADALRPLTDPVEVQRTATRLLADHLGVTRAAYFEMEADEDRFAQVTGHEDDAVALPARMRMSDYGPDIVAAYRSGRPVAVADIEADPRFQLHRDAYRTIGVRAWAGVPLVKDGRLAVILGVHAPVARAWTRGELQLLEEVAQRSWAAVELARLRRRTTDLDAFLVRFSKAVRGLADPQTVAETACRLAAEELGAERAYWAEVDWATRDYVIGAAFHLPDVPAIAGRFALDDWEPFTSLQLAGHPSVVDDTQTDVRIPQAMREGFARIAVGADLAAPVVADGRLRCVLAVNQRLPRRWTPEEIALVQSIAGRCWAEVERARAEAATRESEARYRALFESMDEAYAVVEVLQDATGAWSNFRFLQVNPAFMAHTSMPNPVGKTASELLGTPNPRWTQLYGQALDTNLPLRVQEVEPTLGRDFDLNIFSLDRARNRVAVLFTDITQRVRDEAALRESEKRQAFLLKLSDTLRAETNVDAVGHRAIRMLLDHLRLDRCYITFYRPSDDEADFPYQVGNDTVPPLPPKVRLSDFPDAYEQVLERTFVIEDDFERRGLSETERANSKVLGMRAMVASTIRRGDKNPLCSMAAVSSRPRRWSPAEIALVEEAAERTWAALERARAEAALRDSEARFRTLTDAAPALIWRNDAEGRNQFLNRHFLEYTGWTAEQIAGEGWHHLVHPDDAPAYVEGYLAAARARRAWSDRNRIRRHDGAWRWFDNHASPLFGSNEDYLGHVGLSIDVTARIEAEAALRESEERFRGFAENSADVLWIANADGTRLEYLSPAFERIFGEVPDRIIADISRFFELVHPDDRAHVAGFMPRAVGGEVAIADYRVIRPVDNRIMHLRDTGFPIRDTSGAIVRIAGIVQDVNDLQAAAEAREAETERFRTLAEGLPELVWRSAAQGFWNWASPQWQDFTGLDDAASRYAGWLAAVHPADRGAATKAWEEAEAMGLYQADFRLRHGRSGHYAWFQTRALPVRNAGGVVLEWIGACANIEDQVQARETLARSAEDLERRVEERTVELMAAEETLRQSQKMEAIGQLTGGIAHDFNNMLQGVVGGLEMARRRQEAGRGQDATRYMVAARDAAERAAGLTRRLLAFARKQRLEPKAVDVDALISGMADLVRRTVGPAIEVELKLCDGRWPVLCDMSELEGAVLNLCINGRDAMPDGGRLTIATEETVLSADRLRPGDEASPGDYVAIRISDTGTGMSPEVLDHVLEPFFTTKPQGQGTGLGLSQVYGFTKQSSGVLRIESTLGHGTAVHILLPRGRPDLVPADETDGAVGAEAEPIAGGTVLMVDDEVAVRVPAGERLRDLNYRVVEAPDGPTALRLLDEGLRPDLLVSDVGLPNGMDGRAVAEAARERLPELPVLFMTGYARVALPDDAVVITKPFDLQTLAARVRAVLKD